MSLTKLFVSRCFEAFNAASACKVQFNPSLNDKFVFNVVDETVISYLTGKPLVISGGTLKRNLAYLLFTDTAGAQIAKLVHRDGICQMVLIQFVHALSEVNPAAAAIPALVAMMTTCIDVEFKKYLNDESIYPRSLILAGYSDALDHLCDRIGAVRRDADAVIGAAERLKKSL